MTNQTTVTVISLKKAKESLAKLLVRFRNAQPGHLIFGEHGKPEAVIIPFDEYRQFLRYEAEAQAREKSFDSEVSRRLTEEQSLPMDSVEDFAQLLGPVGKLWAKESKNTSTSTNTDPDAEGTTHRGDRR